ncbi:MAG: hypothetical protein MUE57_03525 [Syntrophales bacterium]|nr:hypothetical protein [Syntrophales bacterium]
MTMARHESTHQTGRMRSVMTITATSGHGGVILPSSRLSVGYGLSKMFVIRPWEGYAICDIEVDGVSIGPVSMYMFTNITENHTIRATFRKDTPAAPQRPAG